MCNTVKGPMLCKYHCFHCFPSVICVSSQSVNLAEMVAFGRFGLVLILRSCHVVHPSIHTWSLTDLCSLCSTANFQKEWKAFLLTGWVLNIVEFHLIYSHIYLCFLFFYISETNATMFIYPLFLFNCDIVSGEPAGPGGGSLQAPLHLWAGNHHLQRCTQGGLAALQTDPHREGKGTNTGTSTKLAAPR